MRGLGLWWAAIWAAVVGAGLAAGPGGPVVLAQDKAAQEDTRNVARLYFIRAKPGMEKQFEEGRKRHVEWHRKVKDSWQWYAGEIVTGEREGTYVFGTFSHAWKDFDLPAEFEAADGADFAATWGPTIESSANSFYLFLPELSRGELDERPFYEVLYFHLHLGQQQDFVAVQQKVRQAAEKTNWPARFEWYALVNGGEHPTLALVLPRANWAAFQPPAKPFEAMLEEAYGREEAAALLKQLYGGVRRIRSEVVRTRPELGYTPPPASGR